MADTKKPARTFEVTPSPVTLTEALTSTALGTRHKINNVRGYYVEIDVSLDLLNTGATANYTVTLLENVFGTTLHSRTVTLEQNVWTAVELKGILTRLDNVAELQVALNANVANMNYRLSAQRRAQ